MKTNANRQIEWALVAVLGLVVAAVPAVGLSQEAQATQEAQAPQEVNVPQDVQAPQEAQEAPPVQNPWDAFEVILNRNMFSRQRGFRPRQDRDERRREIAVPNPESYFRLRGVAQEDGTFVAFLEDTRSGSVLKLREGEAVARGTIKSLTLDTIEYQRDDQVTTVQLGSDLEGGQGAVTMNELMEWSQTATTPSTATQETSSEAPAGDAAEILKQLMERRRQELGR